jgi:outer membrane protein assembly factor BamB
MRHITDNLHLNARIIKIIVIGIIGGSSLCSLIYIISSLLLLTYFHFSQSPNEVIVHRVISDDPGLEELWTHSNVIERGDFFEMAAAQKTVFLLGKSTFLETGTVFAIDASDGETQLWQDRGPSLNGQGILYATSKALYVGTLGRAYLTAYDLRTGKRLWSQRLIPAERGVDSIYVVNDKIYVSATNVQFILQADTGKILGTFDLEKPLPSDFKLEYLYDPIITENVSFVWDPGLTTVRAIDRQTDHDLWEINNSASNPAATESAVYLLTTEGALLSLDLQSGEVLASVQFDKPSAGYVAVDQDFGLLYVYLYDNDQLFAFKIVDYMPN